MLRKLLILLIKFIPVIQMAGMLINNLLYFNDIYCLSYILDYLISHIVEEYNINPFSEEAAYLAGFVGQRMYPKAKHFLCKCHCE